MKAFPKTSSYDENNGMDLRDYFAAKAMQGICASGNQLTSNSFENEEDARAEWAYTLADAMMKAREK